MANNEIMNVNPATGELVEEARPSVLSNIPTVSIDDFRRDAFTGRMSRLAKAAHKAGQSDAVLHAGDQLHTEDVLGRVLTVMAVQYAHVPDEDGTKRYPVVVFAEAPSYWYNLGTMGAGIVEAWAEEMGDNPEEDPYLPNTNQELADCGGIRLYFGQKTSKQGRTYVNITVA